jgi:hypothetical protein
VARTLAELLGELSAGPRLLADVSLALNANVDDLDRALEAVVAQIG